MTELVTTLAGLRAALAPWRDGPIAMVPTMGALHDGHLSLVHEAARHAPRTVVSIFVNPTQFAPHEDFDAYPRTLEADMARLDGSADIVFAPSPAEMYPRGFATLVSVGGPSQGLESDFRPHFFAGVATVVAKLLLAAMPDVAVFGEKDYQQLLVVRRLAADLGLVTRIVGAPTLREADGLAMSSRNAYLDPRERTIAAQMNRILKDVIARAAGGDLHGAEDEGRAALLDAGFDKVDYVAIRDAASLAPVRDLSRPARVLAAAHLGRTRLIDNMPVNV
ncbi:MAG: pantoate--beta-alanine ligase [Alphaproteobacteria bacterium]|nr:pantoate--beta-alanine ligase [Alphaproteobacteria bacterium]